jgi:excisionase family DNA binding protein
MDKVSDQLTVRESANRLGVSERSVRRYVKRYGLEVAYEFSATGRKTLLRREDVDKLSDALTDSLTDRLPKGGTRPTAPGEHLPTLLNGHRDEVKLLLVEAIREAFSGLPVAQPLKQSGWEIGARVAWYLAAVVTLGAAAGALLG